MDFNTADKILNYKSVEKIKPLIPDLIPAPSFQKKENHGEEEFIITFR